MKNFQKIYLSTTYLIYLIISLLIYFASFSQWSVDYGIFYAVSEQMNEVKSLYNFYFTHKGPMYFIFIKVIGNIIGWKGLKIFIPYLISVLLLLSSNLFLLKTLNINAIKKFLLSIVFLGVFIFQNPNASIVYFQVSLILFSLSFLHLYILKNNILYLFFSILLITFGILTRIDAVLILLGAIIILFLKRKFDFKVAFLIFFIPFITYLIIKKSLNFESYDFYLHNIEFNKEYLKNFGFGFLSMFHRFEHLKIISSSGILVLFLGLITKFDFKIFKNVNTAKKNLNFKTLSIFLRDKNFFLILFSGILFCIWLYSKVETNHHIILLFISLYLFSVFCIIKLRYVDYSLFIIVYIFIFLGISHSYVKENINFFSDKKCFVFYRCDFLRDVSSTLKDLKFYDDPILIDPRGFEYIISNTSSPITINNWPLIVDTIDISKYKSLSRARDYILKKEQITLWVRKTKFETFSNSLKSFGKKIKSITDQGYYLKIELISI